MTKARTLRELLDGCTEGDRVPLHVLADHAAQEQLGPTAAALVRWSVYPTKIGEYGERLYGTITGTDAEVTVFHEAGEPGTACIFLRVPCDEDERCTYAFHELTDLGPIYCLLDGSALEDPHCHAHNY
ncbi:hypothetical protein [Hamadaea tsunoensis]|uniref:hypothetical protein n=1 Tax=Hamadaea tsunoensis TaxID=53368 RepID=UPI000426C8AC|nr:hypothetical protein [Hamadaea tsunoensis]